MPSPAAAGLELEPRPTTGPTGRRAEAPDAPLGKKRDGPRIAKESWSTSMGLPIRTPKAIKKAVVCMLGGTSSTSTHTSDKEEIVMDPLEAALTETTS